jgi:KDO2-lipid IV(A) lauroyltransferase
MRYPLYNVSVFKIGYLAAQLIPRSIAQWIASYFGDWSVWRSEELRRVMSENLRIATGRTGAELSQLVLDNVRSFARMLGDYFICASNHTERARELVTKWDGIEHLEASRARGKGTILITGHLGHWELGGLLLALDKVPITVVTLPEPTDELMQWREATRRRLGIKTIAVGPGHDFAFVEMLRTLRNNGVLAMLVDRPYSGTGMPVQQFGHETQFSTAAATLAHHTGASIVPAFVLRQPDNLYHAMACPSIEQTRGDLRETLAPNVQRIADLFAELIRQHPEQWFNYVPVFTH